MRKNRFFKSDKVGLFVFWKSLTKLFQDEAGNVCKDILIKLNMKLAVAGFNYRFGHKGEGDAGSTMGNDLGFRVIIIEPILMGMKW